MHYVFEIIDKSRRKIHLTNERWAHIQKHPEMSGQLQQIKDTLFQPDIINTFEYDPDVSFYYKYYKSERKYLFISVKYLNGHGFMITSFYTDRIR